MPVVTDLHPRNSGSTHYIVRDVQGRTCLVPLSQPSNENFVFVVVLDPENGQEFYINVKTNEKLSELPDVNAETVRMTSTTTTKPPKYDSEPSVPAEMLTCSETVYKLVQSESGVQYVPQGLPFEPSPVHCWHPFYDAEWNRFVYDNCETGERVGRMPPVYDYCGAIQGMYNHYNIEGCYMDALHLHRGNERRLLEQLSIQHGPMLLWGKELQELVACYFSKYDSSMLGDTDKLIEEWRGNEIGFLVALQKEYGGRPRTIRERVYALYAQYNPSKMLQCDEEIEQYSGKEDLLIETLQKNLGPELIKNDDHLESIQQRILCQFLNYDSNNVSNLNVILSKHRGFELQLLELLVRHYGPEVGEEKRQQLLKAHQLTSAGDTCDDIDGGNRLNDEEDQTEAPVEVPGVCTATETVVEVVVETISDIQSQNCEDLPLNGSERPFMDNDSPQPKLTQGECAQPTLSTAHTSVAPLEEHMTNENPLAEEPLSHAFTGESLDTANSDLANSTVEKALSSARELHDTDLSLQPSILNLDQGLMGRTWMLELERKLREQESCRQQQQFIREEEEKLTKYMEAQEKLLALGVEKRWREETDKVMEVARAAAQNAAQEVAGLQQLCCGHADGKKCIKDAALHEEHHSIVKALNLANESLMTQLAQIGSELRDAFSQVSECSQRNEKLQSENLRLTRKFTEMQHQYDLELQGMRIHLDDMRLRIVTMKNEHVVKILQLKNQNELTVSNITGELKRERNEIAESKAAHEAARDEMERRIATLHERLQASFAERETLESRIKSLDATVRELSRDSEESLTSLRRRQTVRRDAAVQTRDSSPGLKSHVSSISANTSRELALSCGNCCSPPCISAETMRLQQVCEKSQRSVDKLSAARVQLMMEREELLCVVRGLRQKVGVLEATVSKLELYQLAIPDIPLCEGNQDIAILNLREDLNKSNSRLLEARAESTILKREIRDLRSLLAVYMSNARRS